jgi:hypothetical protein
MPSNRGMLGSLVHGIELTRLQQRISRTTENRQLAKERKAKTDHALQEFRAL